MILCLSAYKYRSKDKDVDTGWALSPIWALFPSSYDEKGRKICVQGKIFFWISMSLGIIWLVLENL